MGDINNDELPDIVLGASDSRLGNPEQGLLILTNRLHPPPLRLSRISMDPGGHIRIAITYRGGRNVAVQASDPLANWTTIGTMTTNTWIDTNAPRNRQRFYRLRNDGQ